MMGSGKTAVGRKLGERLGWDSIDMDEVVVHRVGRSIEDFWAAEGEEAFRDVEATTLCDVASEPRRVIATGGGVVLRDANVAVMRASGLVVWLQAKPETLARRVGAGENRPLLAQEEPLPALAAVLAARREAYEGAAHVKVATDDVLVATVVDRIEELWNEFG
jgi:shikimate kinase